MKLYEESHKTLLKETKVGLSKEKDILCYWRRRLSFIEMTVLHRLIYKFNAIQVNQYQSFDRAR